MSDVVVYSEGIVVLCVCVPADLPLDEITDVVNRRRPTGIRSRWGIATDDAFADGRPNPSPCEQTPGRVHRLFTC